MSILQPGRPTTTLPDVIDVDGRRFHVITQSVQIGAGIEAVWAELAGNFAEVHRVQPGILDSYAVPGQPLQGIGAARHCDLDFAGRKVAIKERITDWIDRPEHKEFSYDVYESRGFPAKVYNTWRVRSLGPGRSELTALFVVRMRPAFMTRFMLGRLRAASCGSVLGFKHFLESGAPATSAELLAATCS